MSIRASFHQFDKKSIDGFFDKCVESDFSLYETQTMPGLRDLMHTYQNTDEDEIDDFFSEMYQLVARQLFKGFFQSRANRYARYRKLLAGG